jgi:hypothetical protein
MVFHDMTLYMQHGMVERGQSLELTVQFTYPNIRPFYTCSKLYAEHMTVCLLENLPLHLAHLLLCSFLASWTIMCTKLYPRILVVVHVKYSEHIQPTVVVCHGMIGYMFSTVLVHIRDDMLPMFLRLTFLKSYCSLISVNPSFPT